MAAPALVVDALDKTFRVPKQHVHTLKERALHPLRSTQYREYPVLRDISFAVERGEFFGIVGRNGSGKSTLLKCMAGIYRPDAGTVDVAGRLAPFIELGVGFNPDLTARDNVLINGVMMGLTQREARARFDEIIEFAELGDYLDMKLKNYSSGMSVRLAFSVMIQSSADVLLIDEVLAVGDAAFAQKCLDVFYRLRAEGRTIVLVTHDMGAVEQFCHRAMFLQDGDIRLIGDPAEVGRAYLAANFERPTTVAPESDLHEDAEAPAAATARVVDEAGDRLPGIPSGTPLRVRAEVEIRERVEDPRVTLTLRAGDDTVVTGSIVDLGERSVLEVGERVLIEAEWRLELGGGHYYLGVLLTGGSARSDIVLDARAAGDVVVHSAHEVVGVLRAPGHVQAQIEHSGASGGAEDAPGADDPDADGPEPAAERNGAVPGTSDGSRAPGDGSTGAERVA